MATVSKLTVWGQLGTSLNTKPITRKDSFQNQEQKSQENKLLKKYK